MSRREVEEILGVSLEETRVYQEAKAEGREEGRAAMKAELLAVTVPMLLQAGMTVEQIAQWLKVNVDEVRGVIQQ